MTERQISQLWPIGSSEITSQCMSESAMSSTVTHYSTDDALETGTLEADKKPNEGAEEHENKKAWPIELLNTRMFYKKKKKEAIYKK